MGTYQNLLSQAQNVYNSNPYQAITQGTAPVNAQQYAGIGGINQYANAAQPAISTAEQMATAAASPITASQIQQYESPYTQDVVNATQAQFNNQNQQQLQGVKGNAAAQGALGGNREAVAEAETTNQQQLAQAPVIANLQNQGYQTGLNTALTEQQALASGAYGLGNLGVAGQTAGLSGAGAQIGAGSLEQNTQQQALNALYTQQMQQQAFPYQQLQWLSGIDTGVGSQMGGTSSTTGPPPNAFNQWLGLGTLGASTLGSTGMFGSGAAGGALAGFLASGGAVKGYDSGGGVAPNRGEITTIPESRDTLHAQQKHLVSGHRRAQLFPRGTSELDLPRGMSKTQTHLGSVHYNPDKISGDHVRRLVANNKANELLDLGPVTKEEVLHRVNHMGEHPIAVVERQPDGIEVKAASGSHVTAPHQLHHMERTKIPGNHVRLEHPANVIAHRLNRSSGGYVPGFDGGGGVAGTPYSGVAGWIPSIQLTHGSGAPKPPSAPSQQNNLADQMKSINAITSSLTGKGNNQPTTKPQQQPDNTTNPVPQGFGTTTGLNYDTSGNPIPTLDAGIVGPVMDSYRGGVVHGYADGGTPDFGLDDPDFSDFSPSGVMYDTQQGIPADSKKGSSGYLIPDGANPDGAWNNLPDSGVLPASYKEQDKEPVSVVPMTSTGVVTDNVPLPTKRPVDSDTDKYDSLWNNQGDHWIGTGKPPEGLNRNNLIKSMDYPTGFTDPPVRRSNPPPQRDNEDVQLASYKNDKGDVDVTGVSSGRQGGNNGWRMYMPDPNNPQNQQKTTSSGGIDLSANSKLWPALMAAGAGMLSSTSPFRGVGLGQGASAGIEAYNNQVKQEKAEKLSQQHIDLEGRKLLDAQQRADRKQSFDEALPHKIGEYIDDYGNHIPTYGRYNPRTGRFETSVSGAPGTATTADNSSNQSDKQQQQPPAEPNIAPPETVAAANNYNKAVDALPPELKGNDPPRNEDYLKTIPPGDRAIVKGLADYTINPSSLSVKGNRKEKIISEAKEYDPTFDQKLYPAAAASIKEFLAGGSQSPATLMSNGNTAILHAADMSDAIEKMKHQDGFMNYVGNSGVPYLSYWASKAANAASRGTPSGVALTEFETARQRFSEEVTKFYSGNGGSEEERKRAIELLDSAKSLPELRAAIAQDAKLMRDKVAQVQTRLMTAMGPAVWRQALIKDPEKVLLYQNSRDALKRIEDRNSGNADTAKPAQSGAGAPAAITAPVQIKNNEEYNALKPGTVFIDPQGNKRTKQ